MNAVEAWGRTRGMTECVGPLGFTDMDREGLLIEGFHHKSTMYINYNYPYYKNHMEAMSFYEKDNDWLEYRIKVPEETPAKFARIAEMIEKDTICMCISLLPESWLRKVWGERCFIS